MNRIQLLCVVGVVGLATIVGGCSKKQEQGSAALGSNTGTVAGVKWSVPQRWGDGGQRPMRAATYTIPASQGDAEGAECAVSFFGPGQGGPVDMNIDRWVGQFENPSTPEKATKEMDGLKVSTVKIAGAYLAPSGPMMTSQGKKENYRLLGAIVEAPQGMVFFKLTGPSKTVEAAASEFDAMVGSLKK